MTKIIMNGCNGKMGQVISRLVAEDGDAEIVCGVDINTAELNGYPVVKSIEEFDGEADVVIDFSHPSCLTSILTYCKEKKMPVILATTGFTEEQNKMYLMTTVGKIIWMWTNQTFIRMGTAGWCWS